MARVISPNKGYQNLLCHEFCGGSLAVCYCPQCSAIFCSDCFNREHQTERKMRHEKVFEVKPICQEHRHTLEYFDLTSFEPLCIMCLTKLQLEKELQFHVIDNIDVVAPKLYSLLGDKIKEAKNVTKRVEDGAKQLKESTEKALTTAKDEIHYLIDHFKELLDEREKEIVVNIEDVCREYLAKEKATGLLSLEHRLHDSIEQAQRLVQSQEHDTIGYEFPYSYNKLSDLCEVASRRTESRHQLNLTVKLCKTTLRHMQNLCEVVPTIKPADQCDSDSEDLETLCNGVIKVKLIDELKTRSCETMVMTEQTHHHDNEDEINIDVHNTSITPIGDADFYDNEPTNDNEDIEIVTETTSGQTEHHSSISPIENDSLVTDAKATPLTSKSSMVTDAIATPLTSKSSMVTDAKATPLTSKSAQSPISRGRKVKFGETTTIAYVTKGKRGRKRKLKLPTPTTEDSEWIPKRVLRSNTRAKTGRTGTQSRTRRGGALSNEMNQCDVILTLLWADNDSWPFVRLIDKRKCPAYYERIRNPLSLEIVKEKLHSLQYRSVVDFVRDMNQIIENCRTFNQPGSEVLQSGNRLGERFKQLLSENFPNFESVFQDQELMNSNL